MLGRQTSRSRPSCRLSSAGASARSSLVAAGVGGEARLALRPAAPAPRPRYPGCLEAIHAVQKRLRIKLALSFELPDPVAGTPPSDAEAEGTNPEGLSR